MELIRYLRQQIGAARTDSEFRAASAGSACGLQLQVTDMATTLVVIHPADAGGGSKAGVDPVITLLASAQVWRDITLPEPPVGFHSFTAALRQPAQFKADGTALQLAQSLHALERLFEILRGQLNDDGAAAGADLQAIHGHYARLTIGEASGQLYYEQTGNPDGPPLLMLHTAGADSRQFHPIMADEALRQRWNLIAFDLPSHGRSMPWPGQAWRDYRLSKQAYIDFCRAFIEQVIGRPSVLLGCSMGAAMALKMAAVCPALVAGVVALEAPFRATGRRTAMLAHPQVNQAAHNPGYVRGLMSPSSPLAGRRAAAWIYSQGGFQIYSGDLAFYSEEFDAAADLQGIDGTNKGITLLTGSYDYSATPIDSRRVADMIPGARFAVMPDLGHFPMIENPERLMTYLKPELDYVRSKL